MASDTRNAQRHRARQGKPHYARVYAPRGAGTRFRYQRHDPHTEFIVCPHTGAHMRLSTWRARYAKPSLFARARDALRKLRPRVAS